jgi:hypothetical protein
MISQQLDTSLLHRYWFSTTSGPGIGVTAYSVEDARRLLETALPHLIADIDPNTVIEDVDIRSLDQNHVIPNIGPPNVRGTWYPRLNV